MDWLSIRELIKDSLKLVLIVFVILFLMIYVVSVTHKIGDTNLKEMYNGTISIQNINAKGAIHIFGYNGNVANIINNNITLDNNDGVSPLAGILILTNSDNLNQNDADYLMEKNKISVNYSEPQISYYTLIQKMNWDTIAGVAVTK